MNAKAYTEVCEILKYIPEEDYNKIPKDYIQILEKNKDKNYMFKLDEKKTLEKQHILRETKIILAVIYKKYWATPEEQKIINKKIKFDIEQSEIKKQEKYKTNDIFKKD